MSEAFALSPDQKAIVEHRGSDLQIVACAGAGKTEAVSRRVASLVAEGADPAAIVAFTFTERAGAELRERIYRRVAEALGPAAVDRLGPLFVGTIHGWCFRVLQEKVPRFGDYEVIDEHRHAAFLSREARTLELKELGGNRHWEGVRAWETIADIVGNELLGEDDLEESGLLERWTKYIDLMDRFRYLSFSRVIAQAVAALEDPILGPSIRAPIRHLIVDEYQDVNPAQERLVELLASEGAELCVVGDDDQAIYQWRGADVANIVGFRSRRPSSALVQLAVNRRSRPGIVEAAAAFAQGIESRLPKEMRSSRPGAEDAIVAFAAETDREEARIVARTIARLREAGHGYGECAILLRSVKGSGGPFFDALRELGIPFEAGGRTGLFAAGALEAIGEIYAYLTGVSWRGEGFGPMRDPDPEGASARLADALRAAGLTPPEAPEIAAYARDWKRFYEKLNSKAPDYVADYYRFLDFLGARFGAEEGEGGLRSGALLELSLARFSAILADYEHAARRGRVHDEETGPVYRGGPDRGRSYWFGLGTYLAHYAAGAYEDASSEESLASDAVKVLTVHQAKGLEWPIVFLPCLVAGRFPSGRTGEARNWPFPESVLGPEKRARYEGREGDERRLFYVAMTRARETLYCSTFRRKERSFAPSPFFDEIAHRVGTAPEGGLPIPEPVPGPGAAEGEGVDLSFSDLALWEDCGFRYRLARSLGCEPSLVEELGYGHAVHHALRTVAEAARSEGKLPSVDEAVLMAKEAFYAPYADEAGRERMLASVERIVSSYLRDYGDDLGKVWRAEQPVELRTEACRISGRADLILDEGEGRLSIVDYKIAEDPAREERYAWQLRVYAAAARKEGRDVEAAYLHSLREGSRTSVSLGSDELRAAEERAARAASSIRRGDFPSRPAPARCKACDYRSICARAHPESGEDDR